MASRRRAPLGATTGPGAADAPRCVPAAGAWAKTVKLNWADPSATRRLGHHVRNRGARPSLTRPLPMPSLRRWERPLTGPVAGVAALRLSIRAGNTRRVASLPASGRVAPRRIPGRPVAAGRPACTCWRSSSAVLTPSGPWSTGTAPTGPGTAGRCESSTSTTSRPRTRRTGTGGRRRNHPGGGDPAGVAGTRARRPPHPRRSLNHSRATTPVTQSRMTLQREVAPGTAPRPGRECRPR